MDCTNSPSSFSRRIPSPCHLFFDRLAHPLATLSSYRLDGASNRRSIIIYLGRQIAALTNLFWSPSRAGKLPRRPISFGWRIPSPRRHIYLGWRIAAPINLFWLAYPFATPPYISRPVNCRANRSLSDGASLRPTSHHHLFFRPAHPFAVPPSIILAGLSISELQRRNVFFLR